MDDARTPHPDARTPHPDGDPPAATVPDGERTVEPEISDATPLEPTDEVVDAPAGDLQAEGPQ